MFYFVILVFLLLGLEKKIWCQTQKCIALTLCHPCNSDQNSFLAQVPSWPHSVQREDNQKRCSYRLTFYWSSSCLDPVWMSQEYDLFPSLDRQVSSWPFIGMASGADGRTLVTDCWNGHGNWRSNSRERLLEWPREQTVELSWPIVGMAAGADGRTLVSDCWNGHGNWRSNSPFINNTIYNTYFFLILRANPRKNYYHYYLIYLILKVFYIKYRIRWCSVNFWKSLDTYLIRLFHW